MLAIAPFYKRIDNPIYDRSVIEQNVVHNGRTYARFGLPDRRTPNADTSPESSSTTRTCFSAARRRSTASAPTSTTPGPIRRSPSSDASDDLPFFKQSDHIGNAALLYRKCGIEAQVSVSFQGPSLGSVGATRRRGHIRDWYTPLDAKVSVPIGRWLRAFVEMRNLNDEARVRYVRRRIGVYADEIYSRDFYVGIDWRF